MGKCKVIKPEQTLLPAVILQLTTRLRLFVALSCDTLTALTR